VEGLRREERDLRETPEGGGKAALSHEFELDPAKPPEEPSPGGLAPAVRAMEALNTLINSIGGVGLLAASLILTYSVFSRYFFKAATDWQDEASVFIIVGAVFLAGASVQSSRGHIGIEALAAFLPERANRVRALIVDVASLAFCVFFAWKSWALFHEAWVDKQTTSSSWAAPLSIPYGLMAAGMSLLAVQIALQIARFFVEKRAR
jgi:TRAP-type C4-dicarboxylate transport system permease small subunit